MSLKKVMAIARAEFVYAVMRRGYVIALVALPLLLVVTGMGAVAAGRAQSSGGPVALVDDAGVVAWSWAPQAVGRLLDSSSPLRNIREGGGADFERFDSKEQALSALREGAVRAVYVLGADYRSSRAVEAYIATKGLNLQFQRPGEEALRQVLRASLVGNGDHAALAKVIEPLRVEEYGLDPDGEFRFVKDEFQKIANMATSFGILLLFGLSIFLSSNYLLQSTAEEKENKVIESILASVRPIELLLGKLLGLGAAGLLQVLFYIVMLVVPAVWFGDGMEVNLQRILVSLLFFLLGFVLYAALMAAIGMSATSVREATQMATFWMVVSVAPLILLQPITQDPEAGWVRILSVFPLTAPLTMLIRLSSGSASVVDMVVSALLLVLSTVVAVWGGAKVFRTAALLSGKPTSIGQVLRWLRES